MLSMQPHWAERTSEAKRNQLLTLLPRVAFEKTSKEKIDSMRAYGGEVIVAPSGLPPDHPEHYMNIESAPPVGAALTPASASASGSPAAPSG